MNDITKEMNDYRESIRRYRAREIGEVKMQKIRLQVGTYHQRQDGVQMQRIKFPGGRISSLQLKKLAELSDQFATGFIHFTTREDAQLYYLKLEDCPDLMLGLASVGITTREACGNTVRNITASYRSGMAANEVFDVFPYAEAMYRFLVRNKYNQVMGRKFKIAFESTPVDLSGLLFHDLGFQAVIRNGRRGFRTYVGGGLGGVPALGHLYSEFLPEEEMMNLAAATVRVFDRYGERKNRMAARMKFLIRKWGWEKFVEALEKERQAVRLPASVNDYLKEAHKEEPVPALPGNLPANPSGLEAQPAYQAWKRDSLVLHKAAGYCGINVRLRLGDLTSDKAIRLAGIAEIFSRGQLRITVDQNLFLPWVPGKALPALFEALNEIGLAEAGVETMDDTTTCPGADTCRLGITSAKGLGASVSDALNNGMGKYRELSRKVRVKVSGCPNGCAQHTIAEIGFQGAALSKDGKTVPAHELFVGGKMAVDETRFGMRVGKVPAKNGPKVVAALMKLYSEEKQEGEIFSDCMARVGKEKIQEVIAPFQEIPAFDADPSFYDDWGHENEKFSIRTGIKGECAGATVQEVAPVMETAREKLTQAEAFLTHKEYANAQIEAYEAMASAARVPLYARLIDPFTSEQCLWEFENIFVRSGETDESWLDMSETLEREKKAAPSAEQASGLIARAKEFIALAETLHAGILQATARK